MITYILFVLGFVALIYGAEWLIDGASTLAKKVGVSDLIVGLTVVAFGTSLPELIVNLFAGAESGELAIGNVLGSNIANILLILGVAAILKPLTVHRTTVFREIVFNVFAAVILGVLVSERFLSEGGFQGLDHIDGFVLVSYFIIFLYYTFGRTTFSKPAEAEDESEERKPNVLPNTFAKIGAGMIMLFFGGRWIVDGAIEIATSLGVSDALVGLTIVAIGTSLPELAATVIAVRKNSVDIAVGNAVGSNLFNVFWVLGLGSLIRPLAFNESLLADVVIAFAVAGILFISMNVGKIRHQIGRNEGILFVTLYVLYLGFSVYRG